MSFGPLPIAFDSHQVPQIQYDRMLELKVAQFFQICPKRNQSILNRAILTRAQKLSSVQATFVINFEAKMFQK